MADKYESSLAAVLVVVWFKRNRPQQLELTSCPNFSGAFLIFLYAEQSS